MELNFNNNWKSQPFFKSWSLIEVSYESLNLTGHSQNTFTLELIGFEVSIFWTNYWI